ncbi:MAG: hypothetical protein ACLUHK_01595 [Eubacteriales bacterium]
MMMKKDMQLENLMQNYFDGVNVGRQVLLPARAAFAERTRRKKRAKFTLRLVSSFACVLILAVAVLAASGVFGGISKKPVYYGADSVRGEYMTYSQLRELDENVFRDFEYFEYSPNATASYTAYFDKESGRLRYVEVAAKVINGYGMEDLEIYVEFSGKETYDGFKKYYGLEDEKTVAGLEVKYKTEYIDAEWVSSGYAEKNALRYFIDVTSPFAKSLDKYISKLL